MTEERREKPLFEVSGQISVVSLAEASCGFLQTVGQTRRIKFPCGTSFSAQTLFAHSWRLKCCSCVIAFLMQLRSWGPSGFFCLRKRFGGNEPHGMKVFNMRSLGGIRGTMQFKDIWTFLTYSGIEDAVYRPSLKRPSREIKFRRGRKAERKKKQPAVCPEDSLWN